jgi:hypothetical protein
VLDAAVTETHYGNPLPLQPMPAFLGEHGNERQYRGLHWVDQVAVMHNLLFRQMMGDFDGDGELTGIRHLEIKHLLATFSYGLGYAMAWLDEPFRITTTADLDDNVNVNQNDVSRGGISRARNAFEKRQVHDEQQRAIPCTS